MTFSHSFQKLQSLWLVAVFLVLSMTVSGCKKTAETKATTSASTDPNEVSVTAALAENLKFGTPEMTEIVGNLQVAAHVETDGRRIVHVGSPVSGRILRLVAYEGEHVKPGAVLAMLHSTDLSDTQFALIKAASQQELAAVSVKRAEQLVKADVIGRAELERREAELLQASTEAASYRTQLRGLGMTETQIKQLETTRKLSADYPIVTPKGGTVLKRDITIGQVIQPADPAFTIADLSSVWIVANVPEEDAGQLKSGMQVDVVVPALRSEKISGRLSFVSPIVDPATRTVEVRMELANEGGRLKPDELATMTLTGHMERKLSLPNAAVVRENNQDYVFVQAAPEKYLLRQVSLGEEEDDRRVVLSGVQQGERIVTDGAFHLNNQRKQNAVKGAD